MEIKLPEWLKELEVTVDDMPNEDMRLVAECCGVEIAVLLIVELGGISINIPKMGLKRLMEKYIAKTYTGDPKQVKQIALKLGVTEQYVYKVIKRLNTSTHQQTLFT